MSYVPKPKQYKPCGECGSWFEAKRADRSRFCKRTCAHKWRNRTYGRARRDRLREYLQAYKLEQGCVACGYDKHPAALHFDHLDPSTKSFSLGNNNYPISRLEEELEKCQVLCANCHAEKTWENKHE